MDFKEVFLMSKPVIGMIHLAGDKPVIRAAEEIDIYKEEGVNGVIVENYHGSVEDVCNTLEFINSERVGERLVVGVNILENPYAGFGTAHMDNCGFIQFDNISPSAFNMETYQNLRETYPDIVVLGGVRFKYKPDTGKTLQQDIDDAIPLCEAIVTTGEGTGIETPLEKLKDFRGVMSDYPLIVGAGVTASNVYEQLSVADAAIIGSAFKPGGDTRKKVERGLVRELMSVVKGLQ